MICTGNVTVESGIDIYCLCADLQIRSDLFDCFRDWQTIKRVLAGMGWMILWIFLWSLIPIALIVFLLLLLLGIYIFLLQEF